VKQEVNMRRIALFALVIGFSIPLLASSAALAQSSRSWVASGGDDVNNCSRTQPCKTFAGAVPKTLDNGEINCLDGGGFGNVTIAKNLTIDCSQQLGGILASGTFGITINAPNITVSLRNLTIDGTGTGTIAINITAAARVNIENVVITGFTQGGIYDARPGFGAMLTIKDSTIRYNFGAAAVRAIARGTNNGVVLENIHMVSNTYGVQAGSGNDVFVRGSVMAANLTAGVQADAGSRVLLDGVMITHNGTGISPQGAVQIANSNILYNTTGISGTSTSYGNNRIFGNTSAGTAPSVAAASTDHGQQ
jgi:Right handed beta helix region